MVPFAYGVSDGVAYAVFVRRLKLKTNDGYIASSLEIEQKMGACHHLSNCFDNLLRSSNMIEYNRLYLDRPGP